MSALTSLAVVPDVEVDPSDYERPRRIGVRGVIESSHATLHVCIYPHAGAWIAESVAELENEAGALQVPIRCTASSAREAWAALNAEITRRVGRFFL